MEKGGVKGGETIKTGCLSMVMDSRFAPLAANTEMAEHRARHIAENVAASPWKLG